MRRPTLTDIPVPATPAPDPYVTEHLRHVARRDDLTRTQICRPTPEAWRLMTQEETR
jgi:hypothetical protein